MELQATKREKLGKNNKSLREGGFLPAVVYGHNFENIPLSLDLRGFKDLYRKAGESTIIDLKITGFPEPLKVLVKDTQEDPLSGELIHVDFYKANLSEKVKVSIPVKTFGDSPIVKSGQGIILTLIDELEVEALPLDLPHEVRIDVSGLVEIGQGVCIKDLPLDFTKVATDHAAEDLVVKVDYAVQIVKEEEVKTVEEIEVLKEKKDEEGAEGEAKEEFGPDKSKAKEEPKAERKEKGDKEKK